MCIFSPPKIAAPPPVIPPPKPPAPPKPSALVVRDSPAVEAAEETSALGVSALRIPLSNVNIPT